MDFTVFRLLPATLFLGLFGFLAACNSGEQDLAKSQDSQIPLEFDTAAQFAAITIPNTALCLSGSVDISFSKPNEMFGLSFAAAAGDTAVVSVSGPMELDVLVAIFGPDNGTGFFGSVPVAADDDGGPGLLPTLSYSFKDTGAYLLVVTTYDGNSKGTAQVNLTLNGEGGCGNASAPGCDDNDPCTDDTITADGTCAFTRIFDCGYPYCDDFDDCTTDTIAADGTCTFAPIPNCGDPACDDGNPCTTDTLDPATGACVSTLDPTCGQGNCDDGDPCTDDTISASGECEHILVPGCGSEPDSDNDGILDAVDNCMSVPNPDQLDTDADGLGDVCDTDADGDGDPDGTDCDPFDASKGQFALELCNLVDDDCDGTIDEDFADLGNECTVDPVTGGCGFWACAPDGATAVCEPAPGLCGSATLEGDPICNFAGQLAGTDVFCALRVARLEGTNAPTAIQLKVHYDTTKLKIVAFMDEICLGAGFTPPCVLTDVGPGAGFGLSTGHSVTISQASLAQWDGMGAIVIINLQDPAMPLTDAVYFPDGSVSGDSLVMTIRFTVVTDISPAENTSVNADTLVSSNSESQSQPVEIQNDGLLVSTGP